MVTSGGWLPPSDPLRPSGGLFFKHPDGPIIADLRQEVAPTAFAASLTAPATAPATLSLNTLGMM